MGYDQARAGDSLNTANGPFVEAPEYLGGFWAIDVADEEAALGWAARASKAFGGRIDVRAFQVPAGEGVHVPIVIFGWMWQSRSGPTAANGSAGPASRGGLNNRSAILRRRTDREHEVAGKCWLTMNRRPFAMSSTC